MGRSMRVHLCQGCWHLIYCLWLVTANGGLLAHSLDPAKATDISRRIREEYRRSGFQWMSPVHFRRLDKITNIKPYMFLITTSSCTDCREMFEHLAANESSVFLSGISSQFNSVLVLDDYTMEFLGDYAPFGHDYVPRVIFADPDGVVRKDVVNKRGHKVTPYHYTAREMLWAMRNVLNEYNQELEPYPDDLEEDLPS